MRGRWAGFAVGLVIVAVAVILRGTPNDSRSLTIPFIDQKSPKSQNAHVPEISYEPLILLELTNPATGKSIKCVGYIDTGSDQCFIKKEVADRLGLKSDGQPPHGMHMGGGTVSMDSTVIEYVLRDPQGEIVKSFPVQRAPFFIQEGWLSADVFLGLVGFLDRFKEVRLAYPKSITLVW